MSLNAMGGTLLDELGIDLEKLQEIPLESDPEEQALERAKRDTILAGLSAWMSRHAAARGFAPVILQCGFCEEYFSQLAMLWKPLRAIVMAETQALASKTRLLVMGFAGFPACPPDYRRPVKEWLDRVKARVKKR
jgi:hypothetical protein